MITTIDLEKLSKEIKDMIEDIEENGVKRRAYYIDRYYFLYEKSIALFDLIMDNNPSNIGMIATLLNNLKKVVDNPKIKEATEKKLHKELYDIYIQPVLDKEGLNDDNNENNYVV